MARFLVDEDLPRSLVRALQDAGLDADHVIDSGLRGQPDGAIFDHAVTNGMVLVSGDLGFANVLTFPVTVHGIRGPSAEATGLHGRGIGTRLRASGTRIRTCPATGRC